MGRPKGRRKTARVTVNLDQHDYAALFDLANRNDVPVAQLARKAVVEYLKGEEASAKQRNLALADHETDR